MDELCCFTIRAAVSAICCDDDNPCEGATLTVSLDGDGQTFDSAGHLVDCGPVGVYDVDPDTCCIESCPLPTQDQFTGDDTLYRVELHTANGNRFEVDRLRFDGTVFPALCGGVVSFANLTDYQVPENLPA